MSMHSIKKRCASFAAKATAVMGASLKATRVAPERSRRSAGSLGCMAFVLMGFARLTHAAETVTYYYTDQQGTVLATADSAGNILTTTDYRPYGAVALGAPEEGPGYTGHVNDTDTGLVYMQGRYYDPEIGRFLSLDPIDSPTENLLGFSPYTYGENNPVLNIDPDGRQSTQPQVVPLSTFSRSSDIRNDPLLSTVGRSVAADVAFVVGAVTNDRQLQAVAVDGMADATSGQAGAESVVGLMMMGEGGEGGGALAGAGKPSTLEPGPYAIDSIPGHMGRPTPTEQGQVNTLMEKNGCHTCGTKDPGTKSGNAVVDHQPPQALGTTTDFYPHCINCMRRQGGEVLQRKIKEQQ